MSTVIEFIKKTFGSTAKPTSASLAKERLQIIITRENAGEQSPHKNFLPQLEKEILEVISRYVRVDPQDIKVSLDKHGQLEVLDVNIIIDGEKASAAAEEDKPESQSAVAA